MKIMKRIYQFLLLAAGCAALTTACSDDDDSYLVRETDSIRFASRSRSAATAAGEP